MAEKSAKMSRKDWRKLFKKNRRKRIRQKAAQERDRLAEQAEQRKLANPNYLPYLWELEQLEREAAAREQERSRYEHALWMDREREAQLAFVELQRKREEEERRKNEERERIRKEFEEQERKAMEAKEEKRKMLEEIKRKQQEWERVLAEYLAGIDDHLEVLQRMVDTRSGANACGFFTKIGVCRYGIGCSSNHPMPGLSQLLLIPNFFVHPALDDRDNPEYGTDLSIEFEEEELYQAYTEFFRDIIEEFETFGSIRYIFVCRNHAPHLRGNAFIEYHSVRSAAKAQQRMNGRFYASRPIRVEFRSPITWPSAVCGLFEQSRCQKGRNCNYLHLLKNPVSKYRYCHAKELYSIRESQRSSQISQRSQLVERSWDDIDIPTKQRTNWRWSETPEVETPRRNGSNGHPPMSKERSTFRQDRNGSRSDRRSRSRSKERSRGASDRRRHGKESEQSERRLHSGSERSNQRHRNDRSRERRKEKKRSRSRSNEKERSSQRRHKESRKDSERKK